MSRLVFINLPVAELGHSTAFYESIGGRKEPRFSDDTAACIVLSETIHVMLLTHEKFASFTPKTIPNAKTHSQVLLCISADSRDEVDAMVAKAERGNVVIDPTPVQDFGFMYGRSFEDPDGHIWEIMWMDVEAATRAFSPAA